MALEAAIILAAGAGTRMKSAIPKVLHSLAGVPMINRVLQSVQGCRPETIALVVRYQAERVTQVALDSHIADDNLMIVHQDELPGTGRAVQCALDALQTNHALHEVSNQSDGMVLVTASDMPLLDTETLNALLSYHTTHRNSATVLTAQLDDPTGYGRIVRDSEGQVARIVEHKDASEVERGITEVNTSVYVFNTSVLLQAVQHLECNNAQHEFYITDAIEEAQRIGHVGAMVADNALAVQGVNDRVQLSALAREYNQRICESWMREGVTILDPTTTWIDDTVRLECDVQILPGSYIQGATVVESGAVIGPYTTLINAHVGQQTVVERSRIQDTSIGDSANIGPWTYMRPGNELADHTKVGAFVEMKKAHIDEGTKVPHLSYIGDTHIGSYTNIGGGCITANYDGKNKHHTEIGSDVHIGAGNLLVAPVTVADHATSGAGSVIRHNVPEQSLVYSENSQHIVEQWKPPYERE